MGIRKRLGVVAPGEIVAVVGADVEDWARARRFDTVSQPSGGPRRGGVLWHRRVLDPTAVLRGGPLLVRGWWDRAFRQVGVTALGSDSTMDLSAGFTSIPVEAGWIAQSTKALRLG
ncbi:MAG: hypothetical protein ABWZ14_11445 [Acidimicrobiales bacterium]